MADFTEGIKRDVAEIKFLIHDLRVDRFIHEIIHYHTSLDTDLEIFGVDQARALHDADLQELRTKARDLRQAFESYSNAVRNFSPDKTVLLTGNSYVRAVHDLCELILNPLWGRIDRLLPFLPPDSRSVQSRSHYRNCIHWICGLYYRIEHFWDEQADRHVYAEWNVSEDLEDFTRNVVYGYVMEKSSAHVELRLDEMAPAVLGGNRHRFRRMYFNLIMNAVDALAGRRVGMIHIGAAIDGDRVILKVRDNGSGMPDEKVRQLLGHRETLDGELHSLGFVFVRQTVADFRGELAIDSELGRGTSITITLPRLQDVELQPLPRSRCEKYDLLLEGDEGEPGTRKLPLADRLVTAPPKPQPPEDGKTVRYGEVLLHDYRTSDSPHPGSLFAIAISESGDIEFFAHRAYERLWNMSHEDLSPMFFEATVRGRLEEDEEKQPILVLKSPQNLREYLEFKEIAEEERSAEEYLRLLRRELIRIARKLIATGMEPETGILLTDTEKLFPGCQELEVEPFPLEALANQELQEDGRPA